MEYIGKIHRNKLQHSQTKPKQGKFEGFDSCDRPTNLTKIGLNLLINQPVWPWHLMNDLEKQ